MHIVYLTAMSAAQTDHDFPSQEAFSDAPLDPHLYLIIPTFNSAATLDETFASLFAQSPRALKALKAVQVIDGASTDATREIAEQWRRQFAARAQALGTDMRVVISSEQDTGIYNAMNKGLHAVLEGASPARDEDLIGILNSDDLYTPGALDAVLDAAACSPQTTLFYGDMDYVDEGGGVQDKRYPVQPTLDIASFSDGMPLAHPATFVRAAQYRAQGCFDEHYAIAADYDLLYRFIRTGATARYLPCVLVHFREGGISTDPAHEAQSYQEAIAVRVAAGAANVAFEQARYRKRRLFGALYRPLSHIPGLRTIPSRLLFNTVANMSAQVISLLMTLITLPLLLKAYGSSIYGLFMLASSVVGLVALFDFGLGLTTVRQTAAALQRGDKTEIAETTGASIALHSVLGVVIAIAVLVVALCAGRIFNVTASQAGLLRLMLLWQAASQLLLWPMASGRHILAGLQRYGFIAGVAVFQACASGAAIVFVLLTGEGPLVLTGINIVVTVLSAALLFIAALRLLPTRPHLHLRSSGARRLLTLGLPVFLVQMAAFLMRQQTDRLVLGIVLGAAAVGLYEAAAKLGSLVAQINETAVSALLPYVSRQQASTEAASQNPSPSGEGGAAAETFLSASRILAALLVPGIVLLFFYAPQLIALWTGPEFAVAGLPGRLLLLSQIFWPMAMAGDALIIGSGNMKRWMPFAIGVGLLNVVLSLVLVQVGGLVGVAAATAIAGLIEIPLYLAFIHRLTGLSLKLWFRRVVAGILPAVALITLIAIVARSLHFAPQSLILLALWLLLLLLVAYAVELFVVCISRRRRRRKLLHKQGVQS